MVACRWRASPACWPPPGIDGRQRRAERRRRGRGRCWRPSWSGAPLGPGHQGRRIRLSGLGAGVGRPTRLGQRPRAPGGRPNDRRRVWRGVPDGGRPVGPHPAVHPLAAGARRQRAAVPGRLRARRLHRRGPQSSRRSRHGSGSASAGPVLLRPTSQPHTRLPLASARARSRSRSDRCARWTGATGYGSATAATSALEGAWTAIPALASTAWSGCAGPTAPNSQATDTSATLVATDRRRDACPRRWPSSASWAIAGRHSGQLGTRSRKSAIASSGHPRGFWCRLP